MIYRPDDAALAAMSAGALIETADDAPAGATTNPTADSPLPTAFPRARIFFDVDDTILTWRYRLRPFTREVMAELTAAGFAVYLWSGRGRRWDVVERFALGTYVLDCFEKPLFRHRERLAELEVPFAPDYVVDDDGPIVQAFGGIQVPAAPEPLLDDRHLLAVLHNIGARYGLVTPRQSGDQPAEAGTKRRTVANRSSRPNGFGR